MTRRLDARSAGFETGFGELLGEKREQSADVNDAVAGIIADVRNRGDEAVREYTARFDRFDLPASGARMGADDMARWADRCEPHVLDALEAAAARIRSYHQRQLPADDRYTDDKGVELGHRWTAVEAAGLYVPGGLAAYP